MFPTIAEHVPELTSAPGPLFTGRVLGFYIMFAATNMVRIILLGIARANVMPRVGTILFLVGGILLNLPPMSTLRLALVTGGVFWGLGAAWIGRSIILGN